ncbi:hypothetical protein [Paenibacillus shirakamiensis]|uniref:hypothetical protein n=1 Tax=Paenibacillus shirakamiensis TaxID=1265935 RepID=UPI003159EB9D
MRKSSRKKRLRHYVTLWLGLMVCVGVFAGFNEGQAEASIPYSQFKSISEKGPLIAGLSSKESWVPQGLALIQDKHWIITTHYWNSKNRTKASGIVITDSTTGKRVKTIYLHESLFRPHVGNVGGVTVSKTHLWIASGSKIYKIPLQLLSDKKDFSVIVMNGYKLNHKASYTAYQDGVLWIGEYMDGKDSGKVTCVGGPNGKVYGYKLDENDDFASSIPKPMTSWSTPDRIQGLAVTKDQMIFTQSCGRDVSSKLLFYTPGSTGKKTGSLTLPPMAEGISFWGTQLYTIFESGTHKYAGGIYPLKNIYILDTKKIRM